MLSRRALSMLCVSSIALAFFAVPSAEPRAPASGMAAAPVASVLSAAAPTRLLRTPTVSANHVAFAYATNIWVAERSGGAARRLTSFPGGTVNPKFSPDGQWIAFSAAYSGNTDVYVVPVEGGEPKRLTWHPGADTVQGWTPDGAAVMFTTSRATWAPSGAPRFWTVPAIGGIETPMALPRGFQGKMSPDGSRIAYRMNTSWDDERRNYRGGQNKPIWIVDLKTYDLITPPWTDSKDVDPVWVGDSVYFISDRDGVANVWAFDTRARRLRQMTRFTDFDVKALDAGGGAIVFEQGGQIHDLDPSSGRTKVLSITAAGDFPWMMPRWEDVSSRVTNMAISPTGRRAVVEARGDFPWMMPRWEDVTSRISNISLSPTGRRVVVEARGEIFTIPAEKGDVRNLTNTAGAAERNPAWSPDGRFVSYFSDKSGEYKLVIASQDGLTPAREITLPEASFYYTPSWSPDAKRLVFHDTHLRLWMLDVASGQAKMIGGDEWMVPERSLNPVWSPDSRWVAYAKRLPSLYRAIFVYNVESGNTTQLTDGLADATWPVWDASGKYLWFLASTNFALNTAWLDMSSYGRPETRALYLAVLDKDEPSPVLPESDEEAAASSGATPSTDSARSAARSPARADTARPSRVSRVQIDFDRIHQRIIAIPGVALRNYGQLRAGLPGTVFFTEAVPQTGTASDGPPPGGVLHRYQLKDRKAAAFAQNVAQYVVSADGKKLLYRTPGEQGALFLVDADKVAPEAGKGRLAARLRMHVDPRAEFRQIFAEGWRHQRDYFYVPNMHGADWPAVRKMYEPLLEHVAHRADLNYLLDQMGAETAIGHSYVRGGDMPDVPDAATGLLGADFTIEDGRYRIARIYDSESWNPELRAPLAAPGINVRAGEFLLAVNGVELRAPDNVYRLLDGTANRQTVLTVGPRPTMAGSRQVTVVPVANEQGLRARAWVERNRRIVDSLSKGQLAYVHLPNTGQPGYTSFNRYYFAQQDRKGAVIDERYNGGGSAADYIIDLLGRDFDGYFNNPVGSRMPFTSPAAGIWGPKVMIINEMAGSGGDLMPYMFRRRKIGPLIGKRTWGGLVGTWDTPPFVDGGAMIAPRGGFIDLSGKFAVENVGISPDIDVENWPKDVIAGRDPQLERAVAEAMRMAREKPVVRATREPASPTWGERKP